MSEYSKEEIKLNIDLAVQLRMFETNKDNWKFLLDLQSKLYEQFGLDE